MNITEIATLTGEIAQYPTETISDTETVEETADGGVV